jgi:5'-3' exonuclease
MPPELLAQFGLLEDALEAAGFTVFAMVEFEADDAMGSAAAVASADPRVERVWICTPDKDLGQCVVGDRVVQLDRRKDVTVDAAGVEEKFGVPPGSIPDYLALVGDSADGFPGLAGWGAKSSAGVLARYGHLEDIPAAATDWGVSVRGAGKLAATLQADFDLALLFRRIATIDLDAPTISDVEELRWTGPTDAFRAIAAELDAPNLVARAERIAGRRG